jgi:DNA-binding transcriptional regulator YiaG
MNDNKMRAIREETGMNRREFCERFGIPYRTVTDWELGNRHAPEYVLRLLEYYIRSEKICKKETESHE